MRPALLHQVTSLWAPCQTHLLSPPCPREPQHSQLHTKPAPSPCVAHIKSIPRAGGFSRAHHNSVPTLMRAVLSPVQPINLASANKQERSNVFPTPPALFSS